MPTTCAPIFKTGGEIPFASYTIRQRGKMNTIQPGMTGTLETTVTESMLASSVGSGKVCVFSTAMMVAWMEATAVDVAQAGLAEGLTTVGTGISVSHVAATPLGMKVRFCAELVAVSANGKGLSFKVAAYDEVGLIGEGTHQRAVITVDRFMDKCQGKLAQ